MKKKLIALLLVTLMLVGLVAPIASAGAASSFVKLPSGSKSIYVRSGPGVSYSHKGYVTNGQEIDLLNVGSTWTRIRVCSSGVTGYIKNIYISSIVDPILKDEAIAGRVTGRGVNLRLGPGTSYGSVAGLALGTKLKIWGEDGNWYYVTTLTGGRTGWISKTYVAQGFTQYTSTKVNFRKSPNGTLIRSLAKGTTVNVISIYNGWSKVRIGSTTGYVYTQYLK